MPNGERIHFGTNVNLIFEADNLRFASLATISPPERNLPLGGRCQCKAIDRLVECAAAP